MDSPLRQQARPDVLKPKIVSLYETLFQVHYISSPYPSPSSANLSGRMNIQILAKASGVSSYS